MALIDKARHDYKLRIGDPMPQFSLKGTDGKTHASQDMRKGAVVVFFWCNHCPYVHAAEERTVRIAASFASFADFVAINSNDAAQYPDDSFERMAERAKEKEYPFLYLHDPTQDVAKRLGGECTPHFLVFGKDRALVYQGRCDDAGRDASKATKSELLDAMVALSQGKPVPVATTAAMGCSIKWKPENF